MAILGDILGAARNASVGFQAWLESADPDVAGAVKQAAAAHGMTPTGYVRMAIADFNRFASEEDWVTLTSSLKNTDDPGTTCLLAMAHWRLNVRGCSEHTPGRTALAGD